MEKARASSIQKQKTEARKSLERTYQLRPRSEAIVLVDIKDSDIRHKLIEACHMIGIAPLLYNFRSAPDAKYSAPSFIGKDFLGFDAFISDMEGTIPVIDLLHAGVIPIVPEKNTYGNIFSPFQPAKFHGNAYLYKKMNIYALFEQVVRFLENKGFPEDHAILVQNVVKTF